MPDTVTVELRKDSIEQLADLLEADLMNVGPLMTRDRRKAVAARLREELDRPSAIGLCGLPGAGKSHSAEMLGEAFDAPVVSMGDAIRENFPDEMEQTSDALANFAAEVRREDAEQIPEWVTEIADDQDSDLVIIDGVRSTTDYEVLADFFEDFHLVEVSAHFYDRLDRLVTRGREGEEAFTPVDLAERDEHEREKLGFGGILDGDYIDITVDNSEGGGPKLTNQLAKVATDLPYEIADGRPFGLSQSMEQYRRRRKVEI